MKLKNVLKKFMFIVLGLMVSVILSLGACDGSSAGARMLSG